MQYDQYRADQRTPEGDDPRAHRGPGHLSPRTLHPEIHRGRDDEERTEQAESRTEAALRRARVGRRLAQPGQEQGDQAHRPRADHHLVDAGEFLHVDKGHHNPLFPERSPTRHRPTRVDAIERPNTSAVER